MRPEKLHADEVDTEVPLVRRLLAAQFPEWADLPIEPVPSAGTDNAIYRLGQAMAARGQWERPLSYTSVTTRMLLQRASTGCVACSALGPKRSRSR